MRITEEDLELEWAVWGDFKPGWCPHCKTFLASDFYKECDGTDPMVPENEWNKHSLIIARPPLEKEEFASCLLQQHGQSSFDILDEDEGLENDGETT